MCPVDIGKYIFFNLHVLVSSSRSLVSSSEAQWQGKKEEKVPLWGRESCPKGVACQPPERVELRA